MPSESSENRVQVSPCHSFPIAMIDNWNGGEELSCHITTVCKQKDSDLKMARVEDRGVLVLKQGICCMETCSINPRKLGLFYLLICLKKTRRLYIQSVARQMSTAYALKSSTRVYSAMAHLPL